jgi:ribose transport system substrate-binding protein
MEQSLPSLQSDRKRSPHYYIKVLGKALGVMDALRQDKGGLRLTDVAEAVQLNKTTALRILHTLQCRGWISRDPRTKKFTLPLSYRTYRVGYAQMCSGQPFSEAVTRGLVEQAKQSFVDLLVTDNQYDKEKAIHNAEWMIEQKVDFAIEYQIHYRVAPVLAHMFAKARIPTLAIDIPQPGAIYFGANNYAAGLMAGEALGGWARKKWRAPVTRVLLLEASAAGPTPHGRMTGTLRGIRNTLHPQAHDSLTVTHGDAKGTGTEAGGYQATTKTLRQVSPREHLLIGTINDASALGALRAVREASRERFTAIISQDFSPDPRISAEIQDDDSPLIGSVAFFPERYGSRIIPAVLRWLNKEQVPPAFYTDHVLVTKENIQEFSSQRYLSPEIKAVA